MNQKESTRLAQERAKKNAIKLGIPKSKTKPKPEPDLSSRPDLTSYDDMIEGYLTATAYLTSGMAFDIQTLSPGDLVIIVGTPLVKLLMDRGVSFDKDTPVSDLNKAITEMDDQDQQELYDSPDFTDIMNGTVCRSVLSVNLVNKRMSDCDPKRKEVSVIDRLSELDRYELFMQVMTLSASPADIDDVASFSDTGEETENET